MSRLKFAAILLALGLLAGCGHSHEEGGHDHGTSQKTSGHADEHGHEDEHAHDDGHVHGNEDASHRDAFGGLDELEDLFEDDHSGMTITFTREQQRQVEFAMAEAHRRRMRPSLEVTGILKASGGGEAHVVAPVSGYLAPSDAPFPRFGDNVQKGQSLLKIVPRVSGEVDPASLELALSRARSTHKLAVQELRRLEELLELEAVPARRVAEAQKEEKVARAEMEAAERRLKQYRSRPESNAGATAITVPSPINGKLDGVFVTPGAYLQEGAPLFHVIDTEHLRLEARIPEPDIGRLTNPRGAWFEVEGFDAPFEIDLEKGDRMIALGSKVDPRSRTVPLVFEFPNVEGQLRIGMFVRAHVLIGEEKEATAIPTAAIEENAGQAVAYVQRGPDTFERRILTLGIRDGEYVEVVSGLNAGETVVTQGSYLVQLAASGPQEAGHGHAH